MDNAGNMHKITFLFLGLLLSSSFAGGIQNSTNLLGLSVGSEILVNRNLVLQNSMYVHQAKGFYLDDTVRFELVFDKPRMIEHCALNFDGPSARDGAIANVKLPSGTKLRVRDKIQYGGYAEKRTKTIPMIGDSYYKEVKTGRFLFSLTVPVEVENLSNKIRLMSGDLTCEFELTRDPGKELSSEIMTKVTKGAFVVTGNHPARR